MFGLLRLAAIAFVLLTIVYICVSLYSRAVRKDKLEAKYDPQLDGDRDAYIRTGLEAYSGSLRRKLILLVYIVPFGTVAAIVYFTNFH